MHTTTAPRLPQLGTRPFLTDGGIETTLIFHEGLDLPLFAAFSLLRDDAGTDALRRYFVPYLELAREYGTGFVLESPTWRASPRWAADLGISGDELEALSRTAIDLLEELRAAYRTEKAPIVISGCIGPHDDGYRPGQILSADAAREYHATQITTFADTTADLVTAITMTYAEEAIGITRAAIAAGIPAAISFSVEIDGRLPSGEPLGDAILRVDAETEEGPAYYGVNCAHPTHIEPALAEGGEWRHRVRCLRANASTKSHAELDEALELDEGDPRDLGERYAAIRELLPRLNVVGGCCGTDHRHVQEIARAWVSAAT